VDGVATGVPVCESVMNGTDTSCVPYNIFADGGVTADALNYILTSGTASGDTQEQIVSGNITGDLGKYGLKSPYASNGIGVSVGAEYRREQLDLTPDATSLSGDLSGAGGASPPVHGAFDVKELFGEIRVPLVQDMPFVKNLSFEGGYRYSHYSQGNDTNTYKLALDWSPTSDIRFRGSFQRAVRSPNVNELFTPQLITNTSVVSVDKCSGNGQPNSTATASLEECERTGVTAAQYGNGVDVSAGGTNRIPQCPAFQCGTVLGGNPLLTPEVSKTYSVGVVLTPTHFVPGLNFSVDYFHIDVANAISTFPINLAYNECLTLGAHCNVIVRQANGSLFGSDLKQGGYIAQTNQNIGFIQTEGFDFEGNYRLDLERFGLTSAGSLSFRFNGTYTMHLNFKPDPADPGTYDCAGLYGNTCGNPTPHWRHQFRATWTSPWNFSLSAQWRFLSGTDEDNNSPNPLLGAPGSDARNAHIGDYSYFDLSATYTIRPGIILRVGMNNIFDKDPPVLDDAITGSGTPNTFNNFDLLGRQVFMGITADF
jgi:outer membrane receptor protein involved in Fe transport